MGVNGTRWSAWKFSGQSGLPPEVVLFDRSVLVVPKILASKNFAKKWLELRSNCKWSLDSLGIFIFLLKNVVPFSLDNFTGF